MANKLHVRKKDQVKVLTGKDAGKIGEVVRVDVKNGRVLVQGINMTIRHMKPSKKNPQGGRFELEGFINASNVMLYCKKCNSTTRISHQILEDGSKVRICKKCKEIV